MDPRIEERRRRMGLPAPPAPAEVKVIPSTREFEEELIAIRRDRSTTTAQRQRLEADLIARRRAERGEG